MAGHGTIEKEEAQTLLGGTNDDLEAQTSNLKVTWRNLPEKKQLLLLALCRLSTPLSNACLLPYLYYLVKSILSDPDHASASQEISRLTGLLVAAYPLGQMSTSILWGRLSDTYGRKPVILIGLIISVVSNLAFGFSRSIGALLFWRILAGMANGILGVMRTMTAEIVRERRYHARAFLALPVVFNSGRVAALAIGGCLADPSRNLPWLFGPNGIFNFSRKPQGVAWVLKYPYALPSLFNGIVLAICFVLAALWLKESLPERHQRHHVRNPVGRLINRIIGQRLSLQSDTRYTVIESDEVESRATCAPAHEIKSATPEWMHTSTYSERPSFKDIWTTNLLKTIVAFGLLPLHNATFLHIFPVFLSMPTAANSDASAFRFTGGLGLASPTVGLYLATFGICGILLQLFIYPRIQKRFGTLGAFRLANFIFPVTYVFAPYLSLLSAHRTAKWIAMAAVLFPQVMARTMAIPSTVILLTEAAPQKTVLGTVHGAGNTVSALSSAMGPLVGGLILARGIDAGAVGTVWWCWLTLVALVTLAWSFVLGQGKHEDETTASLE